MKLDDIQLRLDQEKAASEALDKGYSRYKNRPGGTMTRQEWEHSLLVHYVVKSTVAELNKGAGI